jgi:hypothetical protein
MPPHHPKEDMEKHKKRKPPTGERPRSSIPPRPKRPSESAGPAATPAEGTKTLAALEIVSFSYFLSYPLILREEPSGEGSKISLQDQMNIL